MAYITKSISCVASLMLVALSAAARDLPYQTTVAAQSATAGVMQKGQKILNRLPGPGLNVAFERALGQVLQLPAVRMLGGAYDLVQRGSVSLAKSPTWSLEVRGDGDWIRFRHSTYITSPQNPPRQLSMAMSDADVESVARKIVTTDLAPLVTLAAGETLQPWSAANFISVVGEVKTGKVDRAIYSTRIVLTRVINGVPVLGAGSKVAVEVANDGTLVGFDIDWSQLVASTTTTSLLNVEGIRQRAQQLSFSSLGSTPLEVGFECGYYDTGAWFGRSSQIQPGCIVVYEESSSLHRQIAVPAGYTVIQDATWAESATFAK